MTTSLEIGIGFIAGLLTALMLHKHLCTAREKLAAIEEWRRRL